MRRVAAAPPARPSGRLAERFGRLLTSMPPMTAKPRTTIRGEPGTIGTSRSLRSRPPMNEKPRSSTSNPSGTVMLMPPQEGEGGDLDLGPFDLGPAQVHVAAAHDGDGVRLAADAPAALGAVPAQDGDVPAPLLPGAAVAGARAGPRPAACGQVGHDRSRGRPGSWPASASPTRSENSSSVSRPSTTCSRSWVTVRSRSASATRSVRPRGSPGGGAVVGNRQIRHMRGQSARSAVGRSAGRP